MCGIAIMYGNACEKEVEQMVHALRHRGPDGSGCLRIHNTVLGHVRLSILDIEGGSQPMTNERGDLAVSFNGEIYNHAELRIGLGDRHVFKTRSDTEVLLHLYEEKGEDMLTGLDGMFALALAGPNGLLIARDPIGIKPLYYTHRDGNFIAASELKAFLPEDDVRELPAGHAMRPGEKPRRFSPAFPTEPALVHPPLPDILQNVRTRLENAVFKRLMSDVPVGVFLSGGLDSSLVAAIMRPATVQLHTFTAGMAGAPDLVAAREVARHLGTEHHELIYTKKDVLAAIPEVITHLESFDAPLVRSAIPMYFVSRVAAKHVKVVLTGEGADELFAGYSYLQQFFGERLRRELDTIILRLQNTNLQRADRMTMIHGIEGRVPFLDMDLVRYVSRLPLDLLEYKPDRPEKWLLRESCKGLLPSAILNRKKMKFSEGAGSAEVVAEMIQGKITGSSFETEKEVEPGITLRSPEELYYYRIWRDIFGTNFPAAIAGRTADPSAASTRTRPAVMIDSPLQNDREDKK